MMVGSVYADTTPNLINNNNWTGVTYGTHPGDCCTGGPGALYGTVSNTIHFSYGLSTVGQVIAINQALTGSGIQINGYNWGYELRNMNGVAGGQGGVDSITATTFMTNSSGQIVARDDRTYNTTFDWTSFSGTVSLASALSIQNAGGLGIQFTSRDSGFWAGYYGPQVRNVSLRANYSVDQCSIDPLSSTTCPGYEAAYLSMQCSANPLYSSSCPGYAQAYYTQQCTINPLHDPGCPGYQQAYYTQQCNANPLYDSGCPGYAQANYDFQCSLNPLYDTMCSGYQQAYFDQQCSLNPLYNDQCPGYQQAYFNQQCTLSSLYNEACPGYTAAYYSLQCSLNPLYDSGCPGYQAAYFTQQCNLNGLYNSQCPNYAEAYAKKSLLSTQSASSVPANSEPAIGISSDGKVSSEVKLVEDDNVNKVITEKSTSASPSPTSTVTLSPQGGSNANTKTEPSKSSSKEQTASTPTATTQNRRQAAARAQQQAQQQAKESLEQAANATSMEAQVAVQANVVAAMGFVPGFSAYQNVIVPDTLGRELNKQYNKPVVDNVRAQRRLSGASDRLHQEMISDQYNR